MSLLRRLFKRDRPMSCRRCGRGPHGLPCEHLMYCFQDDIARCDLYGKVEI